MYLEMLLEQWESFSLPDDAAAVAELIGGTVAEWTAAWPALRRQFVDRRGDPREDDAAGAYKRIVNLKLEAVRCGLKKFIRGARKGGDTRAKSAKRGSDGTYLPAETPAPYPAPPPAAEPARLQAPSSTSSSSSSSSVLKKVQRESAARISGTVDPDIARRAGDFFDVWCQLYAKHRDGATYHGRPQIDYGNCCNLVRSFPNERLASLSVVFLNSNEPFIERSNRSLAVFETRISWCDERLRKLEARQVPP